MLTLEQFSRVRILRKKFPVGSKATREQYAAEFELVCQTKGDEWRQMIMKKFAEEAKQDRADAFLARCAEINVGDVIAYGKNFGRVTKAAEGAKVEVEVLHTRDSKRTKDKKGMPVKKPAMKQAGKKHDIVTLRAFKFVHRNKS
jgi:phage protein D